MAPRHASIEDVMGRRLGPKEGVPFTLHVDGPLSLPLPSPRIAVVGMRKPTPGGLDRAGLYAESLARNGVLVVGGLARGIDAAAHMAAINAGGKTVAALVDFGDQITKIYHQGARAAQLTFEQPCGVCTQVRKTCSLGTGDDPRLSTPRRPAWRAPSVPARAA